MVITGDDSKFDIDSSSISIDLKKNLIYYESTGENSSIGKHLYSINLDSTNKKSIPATNGNGYYDSSISPGLRFALINYQGPNLPYQKIIDLWDDNDKGLKLEGSPYLEQNLKKFDLPIANYTTISYKNNNEMIDLNVRIITPFNFSKSATKKYPVIFYVYGGPNSQEVQTKFSIHFQEVLSSQLNSIVISVDGRGTKNKGRKFKTGVRDKLGVLEAQDQIEVAKIIAKESYIDETKMAIWGWSFGGFLTLKVLEVDKGETFSFGMAVAPVTSWRYYDSIFTERYMHLPIDNEKGYEESSVLEENGINNLKQVKRFLIMHGTGDDNVHFQNSLAILDRLDVAGLENYDFHTFPDSEHSINFHNSNAMVYDRLLSWIEEQFSQSS